MFRLKAEMSLPFILDIGSPLQEPKDFDFQYRCLKELFLFQIPHLLKNSYFAIKYLYVKNLRCKGLITAFITLLARNKCFFRLTFF
ncbi:hypothetical protein JO40_01205 [Treponema putidum]|nr:hypothetical protein JO40_01205 [Treponema putidum]